MHLGPVTTKVINATCHVTDRRDLSSPRSHVCTRVPWHFTSFLTHAFGHSNLILSFGPNESLIIHKTSACDWFHITHPQYLEVLALCFTQQVHPIARPGDRVTLLWRRTNVASISLSRRCLTEHRINEYVGESRPRFIDSRPGFS